MENIQPWLEFTLAGIAFALVFSKIASALFIRLL